MLTTGDVAKLFNVSAQTVINWLEQGRLPFERIGNGPRRLTEANILKYIQEIRISPEALDANIYQSILHAVHGNRRNVEGPKVWLVAGDGQVISATDASLRFFGLADLAELLGQPYNRMVQLFQAADRGVVNLLDHAESHAGELGWKRVDSNQSGLVTVTPWRASPSDPGGWVLSFRGSES